MENLTEKVSLGAKNALLNLSCILYVIGGCGGPLITRLYFIHGGNRLWLTTFLQTAAFPLMIFVLIILYFHRRATSRNDNNKTKSTTFIYMSIRLFVAGAIIGIISGVGCYLYSYGFARLPVSTSSLIISTQLGFIAFLLVKQRFTPYSINALVLLTIGAAVLALNTSSDRPDGVSKKEYLIGFVMTISAALLAGIILPLVELSYNKAKQPIIYTLVLEFQVVICLFATLFATIGMILNNDFKLIPKEATQFELGKNKYYLVLGFSTLFWQCNILGTIGVIFCASSLMAGVIGAILLPVIEVLAIVFYQEKFKVEKGVSLVLCLWGLASYFYGEYKLTKISKDITQSSQHSKNLAQTNSLSV